MLGGIIGDIIGSVYEGRQWIRKDLSFIQNLPLDDSMAVPVIKNLKWCRKKYCWTDDTLCTLGLYNAYINNESYDKSLSSFCKKYMDIDTGFGKSFESWLNDLVPYNSYANGSIMRIGFIPFLKDLNLSEKMKLGYQMTKISHNHIDSYNAVRYYILICDELIKSFKKDKSKECIKFFLKEVGFNKSIEMMHKEKVFEIKALETLYQSLSIVYESNSYEDCLRNSYYVGGDSDTLATVVGNIASLIYPIPPNAYKLIDITFKDNPKFLSLVEDFKRNLN